jgi:Malate/L-lactate dehydrogenase
MTSYFPRQQEVPVIGNRRHARSSGSRLRIAPTEAGVPASHASQVADALVDTPLRGINTHGLRLLPRYLDELAAGVAKAEPDIQVVRDRGAGLLIDADGALGVLAGPSAPEQGAAAPIPIPVQLQTLFAHRRRLPDELPHCARKELER